ncbi:GH3 family domain-containing protein [Olivibacter sitiensis]|uniref:GH3 family domain-containing protein n=1 Tax=Olivibacter sitiensis TaxID=376470 RepID=UPI0003FFA671|nr:GH3 auxin-responsive promoter family protein [Olivibacter sitiensis]
MDLIGEIIKKAIDAAGLLGGHSDAVAAQAKTLQHLLEKAKLTAFGKKYKFAEILQADDMITAFQDKVPLHDYDKLYAEWWHYLLEGHQNVTWPGGQDYFALSSGTTSHSKYIPITDDMLESIQRSGIQQILSLKNFELPSEFFTKQILMLGSCTRLIEKDDHMEGEISGISARNIPFWFRRFYKPGPEIAAVADWETKIDRIAEEARDWDVGSITGIPSWTEIMLKRIIARHKVNHIHDIWPHLEVYSTGGVAFEPYSKSFDKLLGRPVTVIETYLASEGYLATQKRPDTHAMALIVDNGIFFEFVPFKEEYMDQDGAVTADAPVLTLADVEEGETYILLISTCAGAWRYMIGDTVEVTSKELAEIRITGRTKHFLNVVGEQLAVHQMNDAMQRLEKQFDISIKEFVVSAIHRGEDYINKWYVAVDGDKYLDKEQFAEALNRHLTELNKNYGVARAKALKGVEVELVSPDVFYQWNKETRKLGGQIKIPRVMKEADFLELEKFIEAHAQ